VISYRRFGGSVGIGAPRGKPGATSHSDGRDLPHREIRPRSALFDRKRPAGRRTLTTYGHTSDHLSWVSAS